MERATRERRTSRRVFSIRAVIGLVTGALALTLVLAPAASAGPPASGSPLTQRCDDSVRVFLHGGGGIALWEVTTEVTPHPNYLIKTLDLDISVNGGPVFHVTRSFGNKTGHGDPFTCTFVEHFTDNKGNEGVAYGVSVKVPI